MLLSCLKINCCIKQKGTFIFLFKVKFWRLFTRIFIMFILRVEENRLIFRKFVKDSTLLFYIKHKKTYFFQVSKFLWNVTTFIDSMTSRKKWNDLPSVTCSVNNYSRTFASSHIFFVSFPFLFLSWQAMHLN